MSVRFAFGLKVLGVREFEFLCEQPDRVLHRAHVRRGDGRPGLMDLADVEVPQGAVAYLCGPLPFMRHARTQLLAGGVAARDIHYEVFGPDLWFAT